jgi:hypothetical protein
MISQTLNTVINALSRLKNFWSSVRKILSRSFVINKQFSTTAPVQRRQCSHEENKRKVCALCGQKVGTGASDKLKKFEINPEIGTLIKLHVNSEFNVQDPKFPLSACGTCRLTLNEERRIGTRRPMPVMPNYRVLVLPKITRSGSDLYNCYISLTGRQQVAKKKVAKGRGEKRQDTATITKKKLTFRKIKPGPSERERRNFQASYP